MDVNNFKKDLSKVEVGMWVGDIPGQGDLELRCRGVSSKLYTTKLARLLRAVPKEKRDRANAVLPSELVRCTGEAAHGTLLLEWRNLTNGVYPDDHPDEELRGKPVPFPFDEKVALEWLTNPETTIFVDAVLWAAGVVDNASTGAEDTAVKN